VQRLFGGHRRVMGAGRTDRGAHACGQVAAVTAPPDWTPERLRAGLNALLPRDVAVLAASLAADGFDPRRDARWRRYRYRIGLEPSALERRRRWWVAVPLALAEMRRAAGHLRGDHDFTAFTVDAAGQGDCRLTMEEAEVQADRERGEIVFEFRAHHFLTRMVRLLAGTLVAVGRGRFDAEAPARALAQGDRRWVGPAAPAHGLYLVEVGY
jgi:tRNA pseudouridine38-40 synthase